MSNERRAPVQGHFDPRRVPSRRPSGTIAWEEHERAWLAYDRKWRSGQSAERIAQRGGFGYDELVMFLGHEPKTWRPRETNGMPTPDPEQTP